MKQDTEYELLVKNIFEDLHRIDGFQKNSIQHNVLINGRSNQKHQIDVYWEFCIAGQLYKVAVECKNYSKKISIGIVRDFYGVLSDIGNIQGIVVSKFGFQKGAIQYAKHYGISLKEIREPLQEDYNNRLQKVSLSGHIYGRTIKKIECIFDADWIKQNRSELIGTKISIQEKADGFVIYEFDNSLKTTINQIVSELPTSDDAKAYNNYFYEIQDGYIKNGLFGKLKILGLKFDYNVYVVESNIEINANDYTKAIVKDILTGEIKFIFDQRKFT